MKIAERKFGRLRRDLKKALFLKRPFDIALAGFGLILSSPLWFVIALLIWFDDRGPVFYGQGRIGKNGRVFTALKFRSMIKNAERELGPQQACEQDPRVTGIGKLLRATAMDELPQLINIFKGDMSFVGPRALRPEEIEVAGDGTPVKLEDLRGYNRRHSIRPGLTGVAQIFLPTDALRRRKFRYDLFYIRRMSFGLDLRLIVLSFWITFRAKWESREGKI